MGFRLTRLHYQILLSLLYIWVAGTGLITGFPLFGATLLYLGAMSESYIPTLLRAAMRR